METKRCVLSGSDNNLCAVNSGTILILRISASHVVKTRSIFSKAAGLLGGTLYNVVRHLWWYATGYNLDKWNDFLLYTKIVTDENYSRYEKNTLYTKWFIIVVGSLCSSEVPILLLTLKPYRTKKFSRVTYLPIEAFKSRPSQVVPCMIGTISALYQGFCIRECTWHCIHKSPYHSKPFGNPARSWCEIWKFEKTPCTLSHHMHFYSGKTHTDAQISKLSVSLNG